MATQLSREQLKQIIKKFPQETQEATERMTDSEVFSSVTTLIDRLIELDGDFWDNVENPHALHCPECGEGVGEPGADPDGNPILDDDGYELDDHYHCQSCGHVFPADDAIPVEAEIMEWYKVSGWAAGHLLNMGETIYDGCYWGRQTTGQYIYSDGVMISLCANSGRLDYLAESL